MTRSGSEGEKHSLVRVREAVILQVVARRPDTTEAWADLGEGRRELVLSYHALTGPLHVGDRVSLNTTAVDLRLGTGGLHFVTAVHGRSLDTVRPGHIMKLRYTPSQVKVLSIEEEESPYHEALQEIPDLSGMPILVGTLHSQVPIVAAVLRAQAPTAKIAYVMTDGAALPAAFSRLISQLRTAEMIHAFFTVGHAFGGEFEAVNAPSAFAAAHVVANVDVVIAAMGPGVVGTGTPLGTTALEQGPLLDAARALGATPIPIVRASGTEDRDRHHGISHHTITALTRFTCNRLYIPLCEGPTNELTQTVRDQSAAFKNCGHRLVWEDGRGAYEKAARLLGEHGIHVTTMGRTAEDDPLFFWMTAAAAAYALRFIPSSKTKKQA